MSVFSNRKVFQGVAERRQMFRMFDRHVQRTNRWDNFARALYAGEWFEIGEAEHDYMLNILPPLWMRSEMFAMREFLTGSITSVFFALPFGGAIRYFHGYCDLADKESPERMRAAILAREAQPTKAMTREERLEHIWSETGDDYRGYTDPSGPDAPKGERTVVVFCGSKRQIVKLLRDLTDAEISAKLPVHLRHLPELVAA
jgi:hypothetical protein